MYQTKPLLERVYYNIFPSGTQEPKTGAAILRKKAASGVPLAKCRERGAATKGVRRRFYKKEPQAIHGLLSWGPRKNLRSKILWGSEEQQNERAMFFGKKIVASDMTLAKSRGRGAATKGVCRRLYKKSRKRYTVCFLGAPAKICEAKFCGEARSSRMSARCFLQKKRRKRYDACDELVRPTGFEPAAFRVGAERSIHLSYGRRSRKSVSCGRFPTCLTAPFGATIILSHFFAVVKPFFKNRGKIPFSDRGAGARA